jgi:hypothetical protein
MVVKPLESDNAGIYRSLARFDARKAQCFLAQDRQKLLAVVQTSFGTFGPFNRIVRGFFAEELSCFRSARDLSSSITLGGSDEMDAAADIE